VIEHTLAGAQRQRGFHLTNLNQISVFQILHHATVTIVPMMLAKKGSLPTPFIRRRTLMRHALCLILAFVGSLPSLAADDGDTHAKPVQFAELMQLPPTKDAPLPDPVPEALDAKPGVEAIFNEACPANAACPADAACPAECPTPSCGKWIGGAGLYIVQPYFDNNPAFSIFRQGTGPTRRFDIHQTTNVAPQIWLGYQNESGLGVRGRWWYLRQGTGETHPITRPDAATLTVLSAAPLSAIIIEDNAQAIAVTSKLQLQVADFEVFQNHCFGKWSVQFGGGFAYANITQNYNAYAINAAGNAVRPVVSGVSFVGVGPVVAFEATRPLGCCGLALFGSSRTRLLYGTSKQAAFGGSQLNGSVQAVQGSTVMVEELELGLEYGKTCGAHRYFGRVGMMGQQWIGAGNATRSSRGGPPTTIANFSTEDNSNFGLFGVNLQMGVEF